MTEVTREETFDEDPILRYARRLAFSMPDAFRKSIEMIARDGDVKVGRALYAAGLVNSMDLQSAILVLPLYARDQKAALDLVRDILSTDGEVTPEVVGFHFATAASKDAVQVVAMLGCDPNQWTDTGTHLMKTPLARQMHRLANLSSTTLQIANLPPVLEIFETLRLRDVVPLFAKNVGPTGPTEPQDFFQCAVKAVLQRSFNSGFPMVVERLAGVIFPDSWREAAGRAITDNLSQYHILDQPWQTKLLATLLATTKFSKTEVWTDLLSAAGGHNAGARDVARHLCSTVRCGDVGVAVVRNMTEQGVAIDNIAVDLSVDERVWRGTLLHSAITEKNASMVEALINAGASPDALVRMRSHESANSDIELNAVGLAEEHFPEVLSMLHAKRARDAVDRAIQQAAGARKTEGAPEKI